ncbi:MAG: response regulator [Spirochaetales bacterium]|nr:response regulator [Spirochaetales bacterium]
MKEGKGEVSKDIWYKTNDIGGFWCERVIYTTIFDEHKVPIKAFGAGRDVTKEKKAEAKFQEEVKYREAMQMQSLAYFKLNLTQNAIVTSECKSKYFPQGVDGLNVDDYFNATVKCITDKAQKAKFKEKYNRNALIFKYNSSEYTLSNKFTVQYTTGPIFWINYSVNLMKNSDTKDIFAYIIVTDVTNEKVLQTIMETVSRTDYDFFVVVNGVTNSALDYTFTTDKHLFEAAQPFEQRLEFLVRRDVFKEDLERVLAICKTDKIIEQIKDGKVLKINFTVSNTDKELRRKQLQFTLIDLERKSFLMTRIDVNDVYLEQQRIQEQLRQALEAATKANLVKTDFLSRMSHDMRTPMNGIMGLTKLSYDIPKLPQEMIDNLHSIDDSSRFLLSLINDTLDMTKIESNKIVLKKECFSSRECLEHIITTVSPLAKEKNITIKLVSINTTLDYVKADKLRLSQVIINILSNSIKFTPIGGKIIIEIECLNREDNLSYVRVSISDNGKGMSKEFLPQAFEPFTQESTQIDPDHMGTGLGLSIAKRLITLMGGTIEMESELNIGTKTTIYIRLEKGEQGSIKLEEEESKDFSLLKGRHILLCEDHPLNSQIAQKLLERKGMVVTTAFNGQEAFDTFSKAQSYTFDLILMDIRMPLLNGLEATKAIRALKREDAKSIPIVAMTANAFDDDVEESKEVGMNAHLAKPVESDVLYSTLIRLIGA